MIYFEVIMSGLGFKKSELRRPQGGAKGGLRISYPEGTSATYGPINSCFFNRTSHVCDSVR